MWEGKASQTVVTCRDGPPSGICSVRSVDTGRVGSVTTWDGKTVDTTLSWVGDPFVTETEGVVSVGNRSLDFITGRSTQIVTEPTPLIDVESLDPVTP